MPVETVFTTGGSRAWEGMRGNVGGSGNTLFLVLGATDVCLQLAKNVGVLGCVFPAEIIKNELCCRELAGGALERGVYLCLLVLPHTLQ